MTSFIEQMRKLKSDDDDFHNIYPAPDWTLKEYKKLFEWINYGYLIQHEEEPYFIINPNYYDDPWMSDEDSDCESYYKNNPS